MYSDRTIDRLTDIAEDGVRVERFLGDKTFDQFVADEIVLLAIERLLQRITEAVVQIGAADMAIIAPGLAVERLRGFGNRLRHEYGDLDQHVVFAIAKNDVPPLTAAAVHALKS